VTRLGIVGERSNPISAAVLQRLLDMSSVHVEWFVEADPSPALWQALHGPRFELGPVARTARAVVRRAPRQSDCRAVCARAGIEYLRPVNQSINSGLPARMYGRSAAEIVIVAGCDQLLDDAGRSLAAERMVNFHYSLLPAYRGKFSLFWQWYLAEPRPGISFHEVDGGVDSGAVIFQAALERREEGYDAMVGRAIEACERRLPDLLACLRSGRRVAVEPPPTPSYFPARAFADLVTPTRRRTVDEVTTVFRRMGFLRLANGLVVRDLVASVQGAVPDTPKLGSQGITVPLADGFVIVSVDRRIPFPAVRLALGGGRLLEKLE
jgi:folate-dependent phosphoribosylglycinamide formyltransferase PurN